MTLKQLLWGAASHNALLTLSHLALEETHSTMPTNSSSAIQQLSARIEKLDSSFKEDTDELKDEIKALRKELEIKTSAERAVTWPPFLWLLGVMATSAIVVASIFYTLLLPDKMEMGISNSASLSKKFDGVDKQFGELNGSLKEIHNEITEMRFSMKGIVDAKFISAALRDTVSGDKSTLSKRLPDVKRLTHLIISQKTLLPNKDYKEISKPLLNHYQSSKPPLKDQLWEALIELANARSSTDAIAHPLSEEDIAAAQARGGYIENVEVDLSQKENWEDVIFKNCKISISKPGNDLILTTVRFIECSFQLQSSNGSMQELLETVLKNPDPQISKTIARFRVLTPIYRPGEILKESEPVNSATPSEK